MVATLSFRYGHFYVSKTKQKRKHRGRLDIFLQGSAQSNKHVVSSHLLIVVGDILPETKSVHGEG